MLNGFAIQLTRPDIRLIQRLKLIRNIASHRTASPHAREWNNAPMITEYAQKSTNPVTLEYLLTLEQDITVYALYAHHELPIRLASRVSAIEKLPFIVGVNPFITKVYDLYKDSFRRLIETRIPDSKDAINGFTEVLGELTESHQSVIPNLAQGFMECGRYMSHEAKQVFLDEMISARIGIRVIAEHYLSLQSPRHDWIGVVNTKSSPTKILNRICLHVQQICELNYGSCPDFVIVGDTEYNFAYISVHMEYIFMELVKNAMRATGSLIDLLVEQSERLNRIDHPVIEICIGKSEDDVIIRFRDQGGGIATEDQSRVWEYSFTTVQKQEDDFLANQSKMSMQSSTGGPIAGLGFGLPMSRVYGT